MNIKNKQKMEMDEKTNDITEECINSNGAMMYGVTAAEKDHINDAEPSQKSSHKRKKKSHKKDKKARKYDKERYLTDRGESTMKIEKYEQDVKKMQLDSHNTELSHEERMEKLKYTESELTLLEEELDRRFKQCQDFKEEIEEAEKYFGRRQDIMNTKEDLLVQLDEEQNNLHGEVGRDHTQLSRDSVQVENAVTPSHRNRLVSYTSGDEDYILKVNIRKLQGDLKIAEQTLVYKDEEISQLKQQVMELHLDRRKHEQRIKHLETQLQIAVGQLNHRQSIADTSLNSSSTSNRTRSARRHVSLDRMNSNAELSINQLAQINRAKRMSQAGSLGDMSSKLTETTEIRSTRHSRDNFDVTDTDKALSVASAPTTASSKKAVSTACVIL